MDLKNIIVDLKLAEVYLQFVAPWGIAGILYFLQNPPYMTRIVGRVLIKP